MAWLDNDVQKRLIMLLNLPRSVPLVWNLAWDKRVQWSNKLLFLGGALAYFLMPYDIIPDWVPLLGQLDDLAVLFLLMERFVAGTPEQIINQYY
ncbi:MAG: YkvA family protein [Eubacteriales bacterium]